MAVDRPGRVVVGVDPSLSGLQALRVAVAQARARAAVLHAVRTVEPAPRNPDLTVGAGPEDSVLTSAAVAVIDRAFAETMGAPPTDIEVQIVAVPDSPGPVLVEYACQDSDLLVLGAGRRGRLPRWWGGKVVRYCVTHACCPVLVVPPPPLTRGGSPRALMRSLRRDIDQLDGGGPPGLRSD
jgi:nucleotide-binding universal stress UspA family protein